MKLKKLKFNSFEELDKQLESFNSSVYYGKDDRSILKAIESLVSEIKKLENKNIERDEEELYKIYYKINKSFEIFRRTKLWKDDVKYCNLMIGFDMEDIQIALKQCRNSLIERYKYEKLNKVNNPEFINSSNLSELFNNAKPNEKFLLIDIRKKEDYLNSTLKFKKKNCDNFLKILNIPENKIFAGLTVIQINKILDENQLLLFNSRNLVKNVILMDKESTSEKFSQELFSLYQALVKYDNTEYRINKNLLILNGGFEDWIMHYPTYCTISNLEKKYPDYLSNEFENFTIKNNFENETKVVPSLTRYFGSEIKNSIFHDNFNQKTIENEAIYPNINNLKSFISDIDFDDKKKSYDYNNDNQINLNVPNNYFNQNYNNATYSDSTSINSDFEDEEDSRNIALKPSFDRSTKPSFLVNKTVNKNSISANKMRDFSPIYGSINQPTGLKNLGNTCFMNAVIQCLYHTDKFSSYFINDFYLKVINEKSYHENFGDLTKEFGVLMSIMNNPKIKQLSPKSFREMVGKQIPVYRSCDQQDSHEFLLILLEKLHSDLNVADSSKISNFNLPDNLSSKEAINKFWANHLECNNSIISSLFEGLIMSTLECDICEKKSNTFEVFSCLSLPIPNIENSCELEDCLNEFTKNELMCNEAAWDCPQCKTKRTATKKTSIIRLPKVLIIHLKRFSFEGNWEQKIQKFVDFPMNKLSLRHFISFEYNQSSISCYNLIGVVNHTGSLEGGHYTAICRSELNNSIKWNKYDDQDVFEVSSREVVSEKAYLLFYELSE